MIRVRGIKCTNCQDEIWSRYRHDMRSCKCGKTFIDGGRDYMRGLFDPLFVPESVWIVLFYDSPLDKEYY